MASFATPADVKACFRNFSITTEAAVDDTKIQSFLDSAHAFVMGKIYTLYQKEITSVDNPESAKMLAQIEAFKVAGIVDDILNSYAEADKKPMWENAL